MTRKLRFSFLPVFFTCLGLAFAIAVWFRIRSYHGDGEVASTSVARETATAPRAMGQEELSTAVPGQPIDLTSPEAVAEQARIAAARKAQREEPYTIVSPGSEEAPDSVAPREAAPRSTPASSTLLTSSNATPAAGARTPRIEPRPKPATGRGSTTKPNAGAGDLSSPGSDESSASSSSVTKDETKSASQEKDPNSDAIPPQIVSVDFNPPSIHDGESTTLAVMAVDDLSGVRSISGSITGPSGALQGFAVQREGDTNRFVSRISIPKDAAEGVWRINYLSLTDNASNSVHLSSAQGLPPTASFIVTSAGSDATGPALKSVWLDKIGIRAGEKAILYIQADDDKSGLNLVSGVFQSPSKTARIGFGCRMGVNAVWECEVNTPPCLDCGRWQLEQLQLQDKANNVTTVRADNALVGAVRIDIASEHCDSMPPAITAMVLDQNVVSQNSTIVVSVTVSDDVCGVSSVSAHATPDIPGASARLFFSCAATGDPQTWVGRLVIPDKATKGPWRVSFAQVLDKGYNLKVYSAGDPVLQHVTFRVQ